MTRIFVTGALVLFLVFVLSQAYTFWGKRQDAMEEYEQVQASLGELKKDETSIEKELEYLSHPENLEKELRSRFNYRTAGEEFIILVPPATSTEAQR